MNYRIIFPIGDWSDDGHGKVDYHEVLSSRPVEDVREAHFSCSNMFGIDIGSICCDYEDWSLDDDLIEKLISLGYVSILDELSFLDGKYHIENRDTILSIWLFLLNKVDSSLNLRIAEDSPPMITFYGTDDKGRHLEVPGYGCFS